MGSTNRGSYELAFFSSDDPPSSPRRACFCFLRAASLSGEVSTSSVTVLCNPVEWTIVARDADGTNAFAVEKSATKADAATVNFMMRIILAVDL